MSPTIKLLDVVALTEDSPRQKVRRGHVGTVLELPAPEVYEVEFTENNGRTYASLTLRADQLMVLHYQPVGAV